MKYDKSDVKYVKGRVDEVRTKLPNADFHYVPSKDNPADLMTRGINLTH